MKDNKQTNKIFPKISIITPSFNQAVFLEKTILSVLNQNYPNLEYIIIDGLSTDNSVEIIKKYSKHLTYWVSEKDEGQADAINKGFRKASGEIISWLNSDDLLHEKALFKIADAFQNNTEAKFIYGQTLEMQNNDILPLKKAPTDKLPLRYFYEFPYGQASCFYKKECLEKVGYLDKKFNFCMDYDLFVRIAGNYKMFQINSIISHFRWHANSKSTLIGDVAEREKRIVFSSVLNSVGYKKGLDFMAEMNLKGEYLKTYNFSSEYIHKHKEAALFEFLIPYIRTHYINGNYKYVRRFFEFFKKNKPNLIKDKRLRKIRIMLIFPNFMIRTYQKIRLFLHLKLWK